MISLVTDGHALWAHPGSSEQLRGQRYGISGNRLLLWPEEALYLMEFQAAECRSVGGGALSIPALSSRFLGDQPDLFTLYAVYRDWRHRGRVVKRYTGGERGAYEAVKPYPAGELPGIPVETELVWHRTHSLASDPQRTAALFDALWFGQRGLYKQGEGATHAFDWMETALLAKHLGARVTDAAGNRLEPDAIVEQSAARTADAAERYSVYEDWRRSGFVVKSGLKFGNHFRIYAPGTKPGENHSLHVLQVFPRDKLLTTDLVRAARVAHGARKTLVYAFPQVPSPSRFRGFVARDRTIDEARSLIAPLDEDEWITTARLGSLLHAAREDRLEPLLSIADRETGITTYRLQHISLPGTSHAYYEVEWMRP